MVVTVWLIGWLVCVRKLVQRTSYELQPNLLHVISSECKCSRPISLRLDSVYRELSIEYAYAAGIFNQLHWEL